MYDFEQHVSVRIMFRSMSQPVEVSVPFCVLRYLDQNAERLFASDGSIIYRQPENMVMKPQPRKGVHTVPI